MNNHIKKKTNCEQTIHALSIAIITLSSIAILISIIALIYIIFAFNALNSSNLAENIAHKHITNYTNIMSLEGNTLNIGFVSLNIHNLFKMGLIFITMFSIWSLIASIFSLFVSIFNLTRITKELKSKKTIVLNIFFAISSLLSFNIFRFITSIINCIFLWKIKNSFQGLLDNDQIHKRQH